ncbi:MAG: glutaminyl-peptide cyclotransferase [Kiritimatiellae bacterium]|jgi:glutamine cyclotransferase|nr:glutaminyl-peptide cyclotransferase [Kiritimatiellia bacterium]
MMSKKEYNIMHIISRFITVTAAVFLIAVTASCTEKEAPIEKAVVHKTLKHNQKHFTQGLFFYKDFLCETTGLYGESQFAMYKFPSGVIEKQFKLPSIYFGEGSTIYKDKLYWLTYEAEVCLVYDIKKEKLEKTLKYIGEGWGLTANDKHLIMSNGSSKLFFRNPDTFSIEKRLDVTNGKKPVKNLNELEFIDGKIYANIWMTNYIVVIDPETGKVEKQIDISDLVPKGAAANIDAVANGIAYDPTSKKLLVTGKWWPEMYLINP